VSSLNFVHFGAEEHLLDCPAWLIFYRADPHDFGNAISLRAANQTSFRNESGHNLIDCCIARRTHQDLPLVISDTLTEHRDNSFDSMCLSSSWRTLDQQKVNIVHIFDISQRFDLALVEFRPVLLDKLGHFMPVSVIFQLRLIFSRRDSAWIEQVIGVRVKLG
jgi:hypothetical protein